MEKCSNCGQTCYYTQSPEIVMSDEHTIICEDCGDGFVETPNGIVAIINEEQIGGN